MSGETLLRNESNLLMYLDVHVIHNVVRQKAQRSFIRGNLYPQTQRRSQ